jgi:phosphatidylglycerol:prolipoprotein diacylglycerol transferase
VIPWFEPPALHVGSATIQAFGVVVVLGVILAVRVAARAARRQGLDPRPILDFAPWGVAAGVLAGHAVHLLAYHPEELCDPARVFRFWEGLSSYGGLLGGVVAALAWFRLHRVRLSDYGDPLALGLATGWGVARIGCFLVHDHPGSLSSFPLAVRFPGGARHDLGLYEALVLLALAAILAALSRRRWLEGRLLALLGVTYGTARFLLDFLRARDLPYVDPRHLGLTPAQFASVAVVAWGAWSLSRHPAAPPADGIV